MCHPSPKIALDRPIIWLPASVIVKSGYFDKDFGEMVFRYGLSAGAAVVLLRINPDPDVVIEVLRSMTETGILTAGVFCVVARDRVPVRPLR
jgi:hypothetical protein